MSQESPSTDTVTKTRNQTSPPWSVIVFDDPVNLMPYVTLVLRRVFGYSKIKAEKMMMEIHQAGKSIVWSGEKERGEFYVQQLHSHQLQATLSKAK